MTTTRYLYAAGGTDAQVAVYNMDKGHAYVKTVPVPTSGYSGIDVRGFVVNAPLHMMYVLFQSSTGGHIYALDIHTEQVVWHRDISPGVDRGSVTPSGSKLFVPTKEDYLTDYNLVLDPKTGNQLGEVTVTPKTHDTDIGISGSYAYMETKSSDLLAMVSTSSDSIVRNIGPFSGILGPHAVNGSDTRVVANVFGLFGFEVGDATTGQFTTRVPITSIPDPLPGSTGLHNHGIAWKPDETEVWSAGGPYMHIFDMTKSPPQWKRDIALSPYGYSATHWVTFSILGDYAYPSPAKNSGTRVQVVKTSTYSPVASIAYSEDIAEVDIDSNGSVVAVGNQYGIGRKP